tara:strand:- start:1474 stop:2952 length:1479 start_codon:yes stop_codon:yes gene_type:complete
MTIQTAPDITLHDMQRAKAAASFEHFLSYVKVLEPPPGGGRIDFVMWDHLREVVALLGATRLVTILKARQVGLSWLLAAYALWVAQYQSGAVVLLLSQGQAEAGVFLKKCRYIWGELPEHLRVPLGMDSSIQMTFPQSNSKLSALPSTENAGRSETSSLVIQDEAAFHDHLDANYLAVKPTIDAGGQLIQVSTINKKRLGSLFTQLYRNSSRNGFERRFFGWGVRPGRDQAWYENVKAQAEDTVEMSKELYMEQEYPATEFEALRPSRVLSAFDPDVLSAMEEDVRKPVQKIGPISIYQRHAVGKRYVAGTDTSHGAGLDASITAVIDVATGYVVADVVSPVLPPEELAAQSVKLLAMYDNPVWGIEDNDRGVLTIRKAQELEYPRIWERAEDKPGWQTNLRTRQLLWGELIEAVGQRLVVIPSKTGLGEFSSVIRNPDKDGRIEAMAGAHDDYPMAVGIAWQMRKHAYDSRPRKIKSQKFGRRLREMVSIR